MKASLQQIKLIYLIIGLACFNGITNAQYYFFGRNKVQYTEFDWKVLKTEHFDIYYYNDFEELAHIGAAYAENAFDQLKLKFNYSVASRIPLIFYNTHIHFQQTNTTPGFIPEGVGGFFEFLKGRVVIPYMGSLDGFRHVINHELVHVFMTTKILRILHEHRMSADRMPPLWFTEGLAEYWSTTWDTQAEMVMRDAVISNYFVGIKNMYQIYGSFLMYKEGQNLLEFISKTYGEEKIFYFIENFWQYTDFNDLIEYTIGKRIEEIDKEWLYYLKQKYFPLLSNKIPPENAAERLTDFGYNFSPVYYEKDGKKFVLTIANRDGYSSIYIQEYHPELDIEDSPDPEILIRGEKEEIFEAFHLFEASLDISKNGNMVFITKSGATDALHFYSLDDREMLGTFQNKDLISISSPSWSADGTKVVFSAVDQKGYSDIFIYNFSTDSLARVTNDFYSDDDPVFGKNDQSIFFVSDRTAGKYKMKFNVFRLDLNNYEMKYITYCDANFHKPRFSPDFNKLYFSSDYDGILNLWKTENYDTPSEMKQVTNFLTSIYNYSFVDKDTMLISAFQDFSFQVYQVDLHKQPDSVMATVHFNFDLTAGKWEPEKIKTGSTKQDMKYENHYTLDYAQSQVSTDPVFGTTGGAVFSLSDLFGDDNYFFLIYNTAEVQSDLLKSFNVAISRINIKNRTNYAYGLFHFSGRRYDIRDSDEYYFERSFGGYFTLYYPLSKFQRIEATVSLANSDKQVISGVIERKALLATNTISYVIDNSLWGPTGPLDGTRIRILLGFTNDIKFSNVNYFTVIGDYRQYFRLGYRTALALRTAVFYNEGKEARRYFMGGSWDLRGWPRWSVRGEKMWLASAELRFPLVDLVYIKFPLLDLGFPNIRGAIFFDSGSAWDKEYETTLGSIGAGLRFNLFNVITLRYDIGKKIEDDFHRLQPGLFYQFFFGWDF